MISWWENLQFYLQNAFIPKRNKSALNLCLGILWVSDNLWTGEHCTCACLSVTAWDSKKTNPIPFALALPLTVQRPAHCRFWTSWSWGTSWCRCAACNDGYKLVLWHSYQHSGWTRARKRGKKDDDDKDCNDSEEKGKERKNTKET